ncbi:hypothetical protein ABPG77_009480 [Micractinium sp. CCAP 211/92]
MLAASALVRVAAPAMTPSSALQRQRSLGRTLNCPAPALWVQLIGGGLRPTRRVGERRAAQPPTAQRREGGVSASRAVSAELHDVRTPFLEPLARSFILGAGVGGLLEAGHLAMQASRVFNGSFPGLSAFHPLLVQDHVAGLAAWVCLYALEAAAVMSVLKRFNFDAIAASKDLSGLETLPKRMLPGWAAGATGRPASPGPSPAAPTATAPPLPTPAPLRQPTRAPGANSAVPAPNITGRGKLAERPPTGTDRDGAPSFLAKRSKELRDRESYLKNMWYAAALSSNLGDEPLKTQLCGRDMVLFRDAEGKPRCIDNTCPHRKAGKGVCGGSTWAWGGLRAAPSALLARLGLPSRLPLPAYALTFARRGAPLSEGWVEHGKDGHSCVVCPYHAWALDGEGVLRDVPAAEHKGEWAQRPLVDSWPVEEKGGFVWVFYGSKSLPAEERPPIPYVPELDDPSWRAVYEEIEFDCGHFGVFENAIDMAHIHYLHGDSFGNSGKPVIKDMQASVDPFCVTATFTIHNKPVNAFWALFKVPEVHVTAKAFLPSTSLVTFELGAGLNFTTFVNTVPISATKSINRFALVRKLSSDPTGLFLSPLWDGAARRAMLKIQNEDKAMVEQLRYDQLPAESNVRADLPQIMFRKLRQQYVDLGYALPTEKEVAPFASSPAREHRC